MNTIIITKFPPWWIRNQLTRIYNRYRDNIRQHVSLRIPLSKRTWVCACSNGRNKLVYRFNAYISNEEDLAREWKSAISYHLTKLYKRYDIVYLWGISEFYYLEKMNNYYFKKDVFPNIIWKFKAIEKSAEANKTMKWRPKLLGIQKQSLKDKISNVRKRLMKGKDIPRSDENLLWNIWGRANRNKITYYLKYIDWGSCFSQNAAKIKNYP
jgi:hypothetical protein